MASGVSGVTLGASDGDATLGVEFDAGVAVVAAATALAAGVMMGAIGVGGVVVVPTLISKPFVAVRVGVIAAMASYVPAGALAFWLYRRAGMVDWAHAIGVCAPAAVGAFLGAVLLRNTDGFVIKLLLLALMLGSSLLSLWQSRPACCRTQRQRAELTARDARQVVGRSKDGAADGGKAAVPTGEGTEAVNSSGDDIADPTPRVRLPSDELQEVVAGYGATAAHDSVVPDTADVQGASGTSAPQAPKPVPSTWSFYAGVCIIGCVDGLGSALTGTSGPVVFLPLMLLAAMVSAEFQWPIKTSLGVSQAVQVPIAISSTVANFALSWEFVSLWLAGVLAAGLCIGVPIGVRISERTKPKTLKLVVLASLVVSSVALVVKQVLDEQTTE